MVYIRIISMFDAQQSHDQYGLRRGIRLDYALTVVETLISKCNEFNSPIWLASLDFKKACYSQSDFWSFEEPRYRKANDCIDHRFIFKPNRLCRSQFEFLISRGVRQGGVLSSIIFSAALEWCEAFSSRGQVVRSIRFQGTSFRNLGGLHATLVTTPFTRFPMV